MQLAARSPATMKYFKASGSCVEELFPKMTSAYITNKFWQDKAYWYQGYCFVAFSANGNLTSLKILQLPYPDIPKADRFAFVAMGLKLNGSSTMSGSFVRRYSYIESRPFQLNIILN